MTNTIDSDYKLDDLQLVKYLKQIESPFLSKIIDVYDQVKDLLNTRVQHVFPNYTLHNTSHCFRIMEYMSKIIGDLSQLNDLEITLLIYAALLHDIGMAVSDDDIRSIKSDSFQFCEFQFSAMKKLRNNDEFLALQEYVRRIHSSLSARYIIEHLKDKLVIPKLSSLDFAHELAIICESHTKDYDWIKKNLRNKEVKGSYEFNPQFISSVLRLADILDIDGNRTPYNLYKHINPRGKSNEEWKQHFVISNNDKIIFNDKTQQKKIVFHGKATHASIHRKILDYISWVKSELINATTLLNSMEKRYNLMFDINPEINIQTEGYTFSDYKMTLEYRAISSLLMGEKIYGDKTLGLRELIQNSLDACRIRQETTEQIQEFGEEKYVPKIKVILDKDRNQAIIKDNGIGMSGEIIKKHFLNIGVSYYVSDDFLLKDFNYKPIGNFGIGFLSCFMLSDEVSVMTRYYKSKNRYLIQLEKGDEYTSLTEVEDVVFEGTEVILNYKDFIGVFDNKNEKVKNFLNQYFLTDGVEIELIDKSNKIIERISNPLRSILPLEKGLFKVNFSDYLNEIEGYALIKNNNKFIRSFEDIDFDGELYKYDNDQGILEIVPEKIPELNIDEYIINNVIKYLSIALVEDENEEDFLSGMKFTDSDVSEVIDKLERKLRWISIILPKEYQNIDDNSIIEEGDLILEKLTFDDLVNLGHSAYCSTKMLIKRITLFEGQKNDLYLPFDKQQPTNQFFFAFQRTYSFEGRTKNLFMRNVLIKDFYFNMPISASIFEISKLVTNISSRKFIPDISRNNLDMNANNTINNVIGKALHIGAKNVLNLDVSEKYALNKFIETFYSETTDFEKIT